MMVSIAHRRLTRLTVTDDQLALAAADRNHGVDGLDTGLQGLGYGLTEDNAGCLALQGHLEQLALNGAQSVDRLGQRVYHAAYDSIAYLDGCNFIGTFYRVAFLDFDSIRPAVPRLRCLLPG